MSTLVWIVVVLFVWFVLFETARRLGVFRAIARGVELRIDELTLGIEEQIDVWAEEAGCSRDEAAEDVHSLTSTKLDLLSIAVHQLIFNIFGDQEKEQR